MQKAHLASYTFPDAVYVRSVEISYVPTVKGSDLLRPDTDVKILIKAECMDHKAGRITTSVNRSLELVGDVLVWPWNDNLKFNCINYDEVLTQIQRIMRTG